MASTARPQAYFGAEPYLFVSYSHSDADLVFPEITRLAAQGYRLWYDEGITPSNDWTEEIAHALGRCSLFLVFLSPQAILSPHVLNEIHFALKRGKPFLAVHLSDVALPDGLELQVARIQAIPRFRLSEDVYRRQLEKALPANLRGSLTVEKNVPIQFDAYFTAQREVIAQYTSQFVGRGDVVTALDRFLETAPRGYFVIQGAPGQGKTAVACHLIQTRGYAHHLIKRAVRSDVRLMMRSLLAQVAEAKVALPESLPELTKALEESLVRATEKTRPVVLVLDALGELPEGADVPLLGTDGLPEGAYIVVTSRPGHRLDRVWNGMYHSPRKRYELSSLGIDDAARVLHAASPGLSESEVRRIFRAAQGNPLYLRAVADQLREGCKRDNLPETVEDFFREATAGLRDSPEPTLRDVLGLLSAARRPLSPRDLAQITGSPLRLIEEKGTRPVRQFLTETRDGLTFYHERFRDFVLRELIYEDEVPGYHRRIATWLQRPENRAADYRFQSLAHHLEGAEDRAALPNVIDPPFLTEKLRRLGYAVLEDVEVLTRALAEENAPSWVEHSVGIVEALRAAGGDLLAEARRAVQGSPPHEPPTVSGIDLYIAMLPRAQIGADFVASVPLGDRLALAIGDAPGSGLKGAFVARFIADLFRRLVRGADRLDLANILTEVNRTISVHSYFEIVSMQCVEFDPGEGLLRVANAGHPYPVVYRATRGKADKLTIKGDVLNVPCVGNAPARYGSAEAEITPGDIVVMMTDGLTEGQGGGGNPYGYRFLSIVESMAGSSARNIGEAILADWRVHPRAGTFPDDLTLLVAAYTGTAPERRRITS